MSQDLFDDADMDVDDPDAMINTPTEFSQVSAGSSHASSQPSASQPTPTSSQATSGAASPAQLYACPTCKKKLKTPNGFVNHLNNLHGIKEDLNSIMKYLHIPPATSQTQEYYCNECKKVLGTEAGFMRHRANHRLKNAQARKPKPADFDADLRLDTMNKIIHEILSEPSIKKSNEKSQFLQEFLSVSMSEEWLAFVNILSDKICTLVCEKKQKKIFPINQYEECQRSLQEYLCSTENMISLSEKLKLACKQQIDPTFANRLVFRISLKLLWEVQAWVAKKTRSSEDASQDLQVPKEISEIEMQGFIENLGSIFRDIFKKGLKSEKRWCQTRSACLCDKFVDGQHPISSSSFLDTSAWCTGDEDGIVPSDNAVNFFIKVESAVVSCVEEKKAAEVTEKILDSESALMLWFNLTSSHFPEEESLLFMKDIIYDFTKRSLLLKERQMNRREERSVQAGQTELRTHLKRNYTPAAEENLNVSFV